MNLYEVRIFKNNKWNEIRTYGSMAQAKSFAELLDTNWDIKEITLQEANS